MRNISLRCIPIAIILAIFSALPLLSQQYTLLSRFPKKETTPTKFSSAALFSNGNLCLIDASTKTITVLDGSGSTVDQIKTVNTSNNKYDITDPKAICIDSKDNLYIYDSGSGQIIKKPATGVAIKFGTKGSSLGEINDVIALAADSKGYCYALNASRKQIDVFAPDGNYLTWIAGTNIPFDDPIALGINGADELYVMERAGPTIFIFNENNILVNTNRSLALKKNVLLTKPVGMCVLPNGDFFVLDAAACQATQFSRYGNVVGTLGSKGKFDNGIFQKVSFIASTTSSDDKVCIYDEEVQQGQLFEVKTTAAALKPSLHRISMKETGTTRPPVAAIAAAPNGYRYVIPVNDSKKVVAYKDTTSIDIFTITGKIENAAAVACDTASNLYIVDRGANEILMFDKSGTLIRKFGKEVSEKLRDPVSIAVQQSGNIIVADRSRGSLYMWNSQGVFKKIITSAENSVITTPNKIMVDSKDQIYVWDEDANCIYRTGSGGWPTSEKKITARPVKPGERPGTIRDFFVDPVDQVHIYNETTNQIEVYTWEFEPVLKYSMGRPGVGDNSFENIQHMTIDDGSLFIYFTDKKGNKQKSYRFLVPPPAPEPNVTFDVIEGKLQIYFNKIKSVSVVAYGLMTKTENGDSVAFRTTSSFFSIEQSKNDPTLHHYEFVALSWSDYSDPAFAFDDYFSYASSMYELHHYDEALGAWRLAIEKMGYSQRMAEYVADRLATAGYELVNNYEVNMAMTYLKYALMLQPKSKKVLDSYGFVLKNYYRQFALHNDINGLLVDIDSYMSKPGMRFIALNAADSLSRILSFEENLASINNAIRIQKQLLEYEKENPTFCSSLSASYLQLYKFKSIREASVMELNTILNESIVYGSKAYSGLKTQGLPYFETHLVLLEALNDDAKFTNAQQQATSELGASAAQMDQSVMIRYRKELATAFSGQEKHSLAIAEYNTILDAKSNDKDVKTRLAEELISEKKYDAAKEILQELTIGNTENAKLIARIGYIELLKGNYSEASFQIEKALQQDPSLRYSYGYLAEAYQLSSNNAKALDNYEVAIQYLDQIISKVGQRNRVKDEMDFLTENREKYLFAAAQIYEEMNDNSSALKVYQRITVLYPENPVGFYKLGNSSRNNNRIYDAIDAFNTALSLDEKNEKYKTAYVSAVKMRDQMLHDEAALEILQIDVKNIFPSLYKNYADVRQLPIGEAIIANNTSDPITPQAVTVFIPEIMSQPTQVTGTTIDGYSNYHLKLSAILQDKILQTKDNQSLQMEVKISYLHKGKSVTLAKSQTFTLNNRNAISWSDKRHLASFVSPGEEKLIEYNKNADFVFRNAPSFNLNRPITKALQVYTLLSQSGIGYSSDPVQSYSKVSVHADIIDYIQYPTETLKRKGGDCDDLVALMAALFESGGISAAYIDLPGHVMIAFDCQIKPQDIATFGLGTNEVIIIGDRVWIPLESTLIGTGNFFVAWKSAAERFYKELNEGHFPELIPFAEAWTFYQPSTYIADGYSDNFPDDKKLLSAYDVLISQLVLKTKREAITEMSARYASEKENTYVKNCYATLLAQTGEMEKAETIFKEALSINPENATVLNNLANVCYLNGKPEIAIGYYEQASKLDEQDANILINLCKAYLSVGNKTQAKLNLEKAVSIDKDLGEIYTDLKTQLK